MSNEVTVDEALRLHAIYREAHPNEDAQGIRSRVYRELVSRLPKQLNAEQQESLCDATCDADTIIAARAMRSPVFLVWGTVGCYSDRWEWPVKAYPTYDAAKVCVLRLRAHFKANERPRGHGSYDAVQAPADDPEHNGGYDGPPNYSICAIPLGDAQ